MGAAAEWSVPVLRVHLFQVASGFQEFSGLLLCDVDLSQPLLTDAQLYQLGYITFPKFFFSVNFHQPKQTNISNLIYKNILGLLGFLGYLYVGYFLSFMAMARLLGSSKLTARYQITLPEEARKILKVKEGQMIAVVEDNGKVVLKAEL